MTSCRRVGSFLFAAAFPLLAAACGGGSTAVMGPETGPAPASSGGATIQGTVQTGAVAASSRGAVRALDSSSGIRVSVVGAGLSTVTDGSGRFTFSGVPSGRAELRFEAPGIDARVEIEGLVAGQTLTITVRLDGSGAVLVRPDDEDGVEFTGAVDSITPPRLVVAGRSVLTDASTRILGRENQTIDLTTLRPGDIVEVEGHLGADGVVLAEKLKLEDEDNEEEEFEIEGSITSLSPVVVAGRTILTDERTRVLDRQNNPMSFSMLQVGDRVEVEGRRLAGGDLLAEKIKLED